MCESEVDQVFHKKTREVTTDDTPNSPHYYSEKKTYMSTTQSDHNQNNDMSAFCSNFESKPNVTKLNRVEGLKQQNTHEDLRRRAR